MMLAARVNWKHGAKTAVAAGLCLWLSRLLGLKQEYWACVSTIVVMQSEASATLTASRDRVVGTAVGALIGWAAAVWGHGHLLVYVLAILLCMVAPEAMGLKNAGRLAGVAATIILLVPSSLPHWVQARDRFLDVSFGIVVALVVSQTVWPAGAGEGHGPVPQR
jgi:uncharacterized membrane protein YgaE (UPF0421/DUF939 family)